MEKHRYSANSFIFFSTLFVTFFSLGINFPMPIFNISVKSGFLTIVSPKNVSTTTIDAGHGVKKYGDDFLYAHSHLAFSTLKTYNVGDEFAVKDHGETHTYRISRRETFSKSTLDTNSGLRSAIYNADYRGNTYDLALMTCGDGRNDDPNSRLVFFASQIE